MSKYLFVFNVVGLSPAHLDNPDDLPAFSELIQSGNKAAMTPVFPCLTIPGQASLATGTHPSRHGMVANGLFDRDRLEVGFWDQYRSLLQAEPFWERVKKTNPDLKTAVLFWQNTLYGNADIIITPKPMHTEHRMIQWCYSKPVGLYEAVAQEIGPFNLMHYWGPMASAESAKWITGAAISVLRKHRPNLMLNYLPLLDYSAQRFGPSSTEVMADLKTVDGLIGEFLEELDRLGIRQASTVAVVSEYSLSDVSGAVCPNILLRDAGLLKVREIEGLEYLDFEMSRAFAIVDHQVAHVYVREGSTREVAELLKGTAGVDMVLNPEEQKQYHIDHPRSGELVAVTTPDRWFAYYWWTNPEKAPDFAHTVDIHRKPGYDPLELFLNPQKTGISTDTTLIKGSHGAPSDGRQRKAAFLLSGDDAGRLALKPEVDMVEVSGILERIVLGA